MSDVSANVFAISRLTGFTEGEYQIVQKLLAQLAVTATPNLLKQSYYEGTARVRDLGIAIPPGLQTVETVVGWPTTAVDVLDERINLEGIAGGEHQADVDEIVRENHLLTEAPQGHLDALIYGVSFIRIGTGYDGEPDVLVTFESPLHTTGDYSLRARRLTAALTQEWGPEAGQAKRITLDLPNETIVASRVKGQTSWRVETRDQHNLGRVPMVREVNRPRSSNRQGRSEITRAIRAYTDNAVRTLLGMEVAREFYAAPQRYVLGAPEAAFVGTDGKPKPAWESYLGKMLALDAGENDDGTQREIKVGQFDAASMSPFGAQLQLLAGLVAAEAGLPSSYLGFHTDNPPSADGTRALEARLVKRSERRITSFRMAEAEALEIGVRIKTGQWPKPGSIEALYGDPATPTVSQTTDAVTKQIEVGVLPARSEVALTRLGYSPADRKSIRAEAGTGDLDRVLADLRRGQTPDESTTT